MSDHPPTYELDAHAAGDASLHVSRHLAECTECSRYVKDAEGAASQFRTSDDAAWSSVGRDRAPPPSIPQRRRVARTAWIAAPVVAAAAALFLFIRAEAPQGDPPGPPTAPEVSGTRFKGKPQVVVIRDRKGVQQRLAGDVPVRPDDRIVVEVALDNEGPISAGLLTREGAWVTLIAPTVLEAGTHFSDHAARFDEQPSEGWIVIGHPDDVERAKVTRMLSAVQAIAVVREP